MKWTDLTDAEVVQFLAEGHKELGEAKRLLAAEKRTVTQLRKALDSSGTHKRMREAQGKVQRLLGAIEVVTSLASNANTACGIREFCRGVLQEEDDRQHEVTIVLDGSLGSGIAGKAVEDSRPVSSSKECESCAALKSFSAESLCNHCAHRRLKEAADRNQVEVETFHSLTDALAREFAQWTGIGKGTEKIVANKLGDLYREFIEYV